MSWSISYNAETWIIIPYIVLVTFAVDYFNTPRQVRQYQIIYTLFCIIGFIAMFITSSYMAVINILGFIIVHIITIANLFRNKYKTHNFISHSFVAQINSL